MLKSLWKDPVWAAVIATAIAGGVSALGTYLLGLWPSISSAAVSLWVFLRASTQVSNWVLVVLAVLALLALLGIAVFLVALWDSASDSTGSVLTAYTTDNFFGLRWRWQYDGGAIHRLNTFCPNCDYQVFPERVSTYQAVSRIAFACDSCGMNLGAFNEPYDQLESKTRRFIQQKIRNNTWKMPSETTASQ